MNNLSPKQIEALTIRFESSTEALSMMLDKLKEVNKCCITFDAIGLQKALAEVQTTQAELDLRFKWQSGELLKLFEGHSYKEAYYAAKDVPELKECTDNYFKLASEVLEWQQKVRDNHAKTCQFIEEKIGRINGQGTI
ncbi:hypothetical protein [Vibrio crassostreae]|uniref:hypothetical protein n=1 Tax=Vibrio crassostreae TaxID=246167 RepID=UPI001B30B4FA|nr:hypothetical protein [Vibrio crassostreae]